MTWFRTVRCQPHAARVTIFRSSWGDPVLSDHRTWFRTVHCLLYVSQGLWKFWNFVAPLLHLYSAAPSAVQAVSKSLGKLTKVPLSRPSTFGKKRAFFGQGPWRFGNFVIMVNTDTAERGFGRKKNQETDQWLIQYRIYVKFEGVLGPGSEQCIVCCMSAKVFESFGIS